MKKKPQKRKYEVIGTDIEIEYEEMDTEEEESEVRKLTKEELEIYQQYKEFYTIQGRTKGMIPSFSYIHRLKFKKHYRGVLSDVAEMLSHPIKGEVQDIDHITEQEIIEIEKNMLWCHKDELILDQKRRQLYCALIQTLIQM